MDTLGGITRRAFLALSAVEALAASLDAVAQEQRVVHVNPQTENLETILKNVKTHVVMDEGVYHIGYDIFIDHGSRLTIEPGTKVIFEFNRPHQDIAGGGIICLGTLIADGTREKPITFTGNTSPGSSGYDRWKNISFHGEGADNSVLNNCVIRYGSGRFWFPSADSTSNDKGGIHKGDTTSLRGSNCIFSQGGGLYFYKSSPTVTNCVIEQNDAGQMGGGICCYMSNVKISGCTINNNAGSDGGGIYVARGSPIIEGNTISGNEVNYGSSGCSNCGGGISCEVFEKSDPTIVGNTIEKNVGAYAGGGINIVCPAGFVYRNERIHGNVVRNNFAVSSGAGIGAGHNDYSHGLTFIFQNNLIEGNKLAPGDTHKTH